MRITTKENDIESILYSEKQIAAMVETLGQQLTADYAGTRPVMICVLKGASLFFTDLCREMDCNLDMDFITVSSYGASSKSSGVVKLTKDVDVDITGRHVLILEDILDSGRTLKGIVELLKSRNPASVKICTLLDKPEGRKVELSADYVCYNVPNEFVVGFGLDYDGYYRNLPFVGVVKPEVYQNN